MMDRERDKLELTGKILSIFRNAADEAGKMALTEYASRVSGHDAMDAFEMAIEMLQRAVNDTRRMASKLSENELHELIKRFPDEPKKNSYNQT